jgi:hypothetical protein
VASAAASSAATAAASAGSSRSGTTVSASARARPHRANSPGSRLAACASNNSSARVASGPEVVAGNSDNTPVITAADSTPTRPPANAAATPTQRGNTSARPVSRCASREESWNRRRNHPAVLACANWARTPRHSAWATNPAVTASTLDRTDSAAPSAATTSLSESDQHASEAASASSSCAETTAATTGCTPTGALPVVSTPAAIRRNYRQPPTKPGRESGRA